MKRLFIAAPISRELKNRIKEIEQRTHLSIPWIPLENLHLTLLFLGDVEEERISLIQDAMRSIQFSAFEAMATHVDYAPNQNMPNFSKREKFGAEHSSITFNMIWLYIEQQKKFQELEMQLDRTFYAQNIKYEKSRHAFIPHINLVRLNHEMSMPVEHAVHMPFLISELCLFESKLQRPFVSYTKLDGVFLKTEGY